MARTFPVLLACCLAFLAVRCALGDTVELRDGARLTGCVEVGAREVIVRTECGRVVLPARRVACVLPEGRPSWAMAERASAERAHRGPAAQPSGDDVERPPKAEWRLYEVTDLLVSFGDGAAAGGPTAARAERLALVVQGACGEGTWAVPGLLVAGRAPAQPVVQPVAADEAEGG